MPDQSGPASPQYEAGDVIYIRVALPKGITSPAQKYRTRQAIARRFLSNADYRRRELAQLSPPAELKLAA